MARTAAGCGNDDDVVLLRFTQLRVSGPTIRLWKGIGKNSTPSGGKELEISCLFVIINVGVVVGGYHELGLVGVAGTYQDVFLRDIVTIVIGG